jgi:hypothetical protein
MESNSIHLKKISFLAIKSGALLLLAACGAPVADQSELDITVTARDPNYNFAAVKTYTLPTTVVMIQDPNSTTTPTIDTSTNDFVITQVANHFNSAGYQRLTDSSGPKPDFFVQVSGMRTTSTDVYYSAWSGYWGGYYAPWYGGLSVGYAPVPYSYVITSTLGSIIVNMTNPNQPDPSTQKIPSQWVAVLNGLLDGSSTPEIQSRIETGLNEAFNQAPYLKAG